MLLTDLLEVSFRQIYRNKRRYRGAIIGTALGIAGLVTLLTIGESVERAIGRNLELLGSATIVKAQWDFSRTQRWHHGSFTQRDIDSLRALPGVLYVSPTVWKGNQNLSYMKKKSIVRLLGAEENFFETIYLPVSKGRPFTEQDLGYKSHVCVIGRTIETELFGEEESIGKPVLLQGIPFSVVGVLGEAEDPDFQKTVLVPLTVAMPKLKEMHEIRDVYVRAENWDRAPELSKEVAAQLQANQPGYAEAILVSYYAERISSIKTIVFIFKFFLYAAILVALVLGGLGITNVMLMLVNERTREIGLRQAVGATERMIMSQFLCESLSVSLAGAAAGIFGAALAVILLQILLNVSAGTMVFLLSILVSVIIGICLGVVSGLVPARKAGRLNVVDAMKFE